MVCGRGAVFTCHGRAVGGQQNVCGGKGIVRLFASMFRYVGEAAVSPLKLPEKRHKTYFRIVRTVAKSLHGGNPLLKERRVAHNGQRYFIRICNAQGAADIARKPCRVKR